MIYKGFTGVEPLFRNSLKMTITQLHQQLTHALIVLYDDIEAKEIAYRVLECYLEKSKVELILDGKKNVDSAVELLCSQALQRLLKAEPLQYVLGKANFYDLPFQVREGVLIPRPETEELVEMIIQTFVSKKVSILDIGTGSGCIPITLKKHLPQCTVSACDISFTALVIAEQNALDNGVEVSFFQRDILDTTLPIEEKYDVIVSNPPYVLNQEKVRMRPNVLDFEPELALFVDDNTPLVFYEAIAHFAQKTLNKGGALFFEINEAFGEEMCTMLMNIGYSKVQVHQDLFSKDRMVSAVWA